MNVGTITYNGNKIADIANSGTITLECLNQIMATNVVVNTTVETYNGSLYIPPRVGGRIFYVDSTSSGATYTFYDSSMNVLSTQTVEGLANAYYYTVSGTPNKDKFYVADSTNALRKFDGTNYCMWSISKEYLGTYSLDIDDFSTAQTTVGTGKRNTAWFNKFRNNSGYFPAHNSVSGKVTCWDFAKSCNENSVNGCTDWFVPSCGEVTQLRQSGIWGSSKVDWVNTTKYGSNTWSALWSSSAHSIYGEYYYGWRWYADTSNSYDEASRTDRDRQGAYSLCAIRAF